MFKKIILPIALLISVQSFGQVTAQNRNFNEAKVHLANHKLNQAIPILEKLWQSDPRNANLNYLLGLCYVKEDHDIPKAVELLETASSIYSSDYSPESNKERRAPEYVYYYLTIAYSKSGKCEEALRSLNKFYQVYTYSDEYYLVDGQKWVRECNLVEKEKAEKPKEEKVEPTVEPVVEELVEPVLSDSLTKEKEAREAIVAEVIQDKKEPQIKERLIPFSDWEHLRTRDVSFTTLNSLYGVQVAALVDLKPTRDFQNLKNVEVYVDENGIFRYVIGRFLYRKQAESLLAKIVEQGYADAFIVDINQPYYAKEVIGLGPSNIDWHIDGKVEFKVQVGAFTTIVTSAVAEKFLSIDGIKTNQENTLTTLTVGGYPTYEEAVTKREELKSVGIEDAFVVAYNRGARMPLKEAKEFVEKSKIDNPIETIEKSEKPELERKRADF